MLLVGVRLRWDTIGDLSVKHTSRHYKEGIFIRNH